MSASLLLALTATASSGQSPAFAKAQRLNLAPTAPAAYSSSLPEGPSPITQAAAPSQATPPQNETEAQLKERERIEEGNREVKQAKKQRAGGVLPLFNVVISGTTVPLTAAQKFDLSWHTIIDPYTFALAVLFGGGLGELEDSHTGYDHGTAGFFRRIGASYADNAIGNVVGNAILPVLLHQDPRYYRKGEGGILRRALYSASTTFICKGDNGNKQFNTSNIVGNFVSGGISNAYYPSDERGVGLTLENAVFVTLEGMLGGQILEFSPDLSSYLHRRREHHRMMQQQSVAAAARAGKPARAIPGTVPPDPQPTPTPHP